MKNRHHGMQINCCGISQKQLHIDVLQFHRNLFLDKLNAFVDHKNPATRLFSRPSRSLH
jgi:hypothetical protein